MFSSALKTTFSGLTGVGDFSRRAFSRIAEAMVKSLTFAEVKDKLKTPTTILLDVREPSELKSDGKIAGSRNIPVGEVAAALKMGNDDFKAKYGFPKPQPSDDIVVHCKSGVRARNAANILVDSGYAKVEVYPGIMNWIENGGRVEK